MYSRCKSNISSCSPQKIHKRLFNHQHSNIQHQMNEFLSNQQEKAYFSFNLLQVHLHFIQILFCFYLNKFYDFLAAFAKYLSFSFVNEFPVEVAQMDQLFE